MINQSKNNILQGRVSGVRNLGGIVFITLLSNNKKNSLICSKDSVNVMVFNRVKKIKKGDYCSVEIDFVENEFRITELQIHLPSKSGSLWTEQQLDILTAYSYLLLLLRQHASNNGYVEVRVPSVHYGQDKDEVFPLEFFDHPARLSSSNSLFLNLYAVQLSNAYCLQKCYRAESSHTNRHLAEFDMLEIAKINCNLSKSMEELENLIKYVVSEWSTSAFSTMLKVDASLILNSNFSTIDYKELEDKYGLYGKGLGKYDREIAEDLPTFVIHFPRKIASWIAKPVDSNYSLSFNLLVPEVGEIAEGNEKQSDLDVLARKFKLAGVEKQLRWYIDMMPYSGLLLSGFGLGVERLFMWLTGLHNIRQINPIFRDTGFSEIPKKVGRNNE